MQRIMTGLFASLFILIGVGSSEGAILKSTTVDLLEPRFFSLESAKAPIEVAARGGHHRHYRHRHHHHHHHRDRHYRGHGGYRRHGGYHGHYYAPPVYRYHGYRPYCDYGYGSGFSLYLGF